jgi:hypothetical protein
MAKPAQQILVQNSSGAGGDFGGRVGSYLNGLARRFIQQSKTARAYDNIFAKKTFFLIESDQKNFSKMSPILDDYGGDILDLSCETPMSRTHQYRKVMKPLLERKRRARINKCLDDLKELMVTALQAEGESITK